MIVEMSGTTSESGSQKMDLEDPSDLMDQLNLQDDELDVLV